MKTSWAMAGISVLALAGCAWGGSSGVTQVDKDTYMLTASSLWRGNDGVAIEGLRQADAYCRNLGRRMRVVGSERSEGLPVVLPPRALLSFKCDALPAQAPASAPAPQTPPQAAPQATPAKNPNAG